MVELEDPPPFGESGLETAEEQSTVRKDQKTREGYASIRRVPRGTLTSLLLQCRLRVDCAHHDE